MDRPRFKTRGRQSSAGALAASKGLDFLGDERTDLRVVRDRQGALEPLRPAGR
jgi:hypothetical protein